ncbi:MAG: TetR/AcrR family transcriptional regulator [Bacteroidetes bacterium]|nr:TetR/AcrR family transcriptional regulator [Bacteroidota bacterium]
MGVNERKSRERSSRREAILDAAEKIFSTKGVITSTIDEIAREAELGKGTLYNYFPSKEAILWYCAVRGMKILTGMMLSSVSPGNEPLINLRKMAESFMKFALRHNNYFRIFLTVGMGFSIPSGLTGNEVKEVFEKESPYLLIMEELKRGRASGLFRSDVDLNLLTHGVWIQFYSFMQLISLNPEMVAAFGLNHEKLIETNMMMIINGIRKDSGV